jgi:hypothetical protein
VISSGATAPGGASLNAESDSIVVKGLPVANGGCVGFRP